MYPIAIPVECALTGIRQAGHPGRAPTGRGTGSTWGSGALLGGGRGVLIWASSAEALPPPPAPPPSISTPETETAEFLGEDLQQVRAWAGCGWQGRSMQAVNRGLGRDTSWGPRLSHSPSCGP